MLFCNRNIDCYLFEHDLNQLNYIGKSCQSFIHIYNYIYTHIDICTKNYVLGLYLVMRLMTYARGS